MTRRRQRCGLIGLSPEERASLTAAVEAFMATRCQAVSTVPIPEMGRRPGREFYTCGRDAEHPPPHRWPADTGSIAEWE